MAGVLYKYLLACLAISLCFGCGPRPSAGAVLSPPLSSGFPAEVAVIFPPNTDPYPKDWGMSAKPLPGQHQSYARALLRRAAKKYPVEFLRKHLKQVCVLSEISYEDVPYGGTYDERIKTVYLIHQPGYPDFIEDTFHHEFSSILLICHPPKNFSGKWKELEKYDSELSTESSFNALKDDSIALDYDPSWHVKGYLNSYSTASPEEDFNCIVEGLFNGGRAFWSVVDSYPKVRAKALMAISFYQSLDMRFTEVYFRGLPDRRLD
jgi:hypothetical protein